MTEGQRSMKQRMLSGEPYLAEDPELRADSQRASALIEEFNRSPASDAALRLHLLTSLLGSFGEGSEIRPPLYVDYGYQTSVGARTFVNFGLVALDVAPIVIGDDVQIGPRVQLLSATHPMAPEARRQKWESGAPIAIGHNVWLGGGVIVCAGVTIGEDTVVGAGSVVTRDLPPGVFAVGAPARAARALT